MKRPRLLPCLLLAVGLPVQADTLRCGSRLISQGDLVSEALDKCGAPVERRPRGYKLVVDHYGLRHEVLVEEWLYGPRHGMYHLLRFEGGRLVEVDSFRGD